VTRLQNGARLQRLRDIDARLRQLTAQRGVLEETGRSAPEDHQQIAAIDDELALLRLERDQLIAAEPPPSLPALPTIEQRVAYLSEAVLSIYPEITGLHKAVSEWREQDAAARERERQERREARERERQDQREAAQREAAQREARQATVDARMDALTRWMVAGAVAMLVEWLLVFGLILALVLR
jgi:hypothetical protein